MVRDVAPGEALFIDPNGNVHAKQCAENPTLNPCMFEYVYLARPDSVIDGISVYQARLNMGETLAQRLISTMPPSDIDVVIPIPESSRPSAMQLAQKIGKPYREGFVKNRYVGRTFIMPGQSVRKKSVRQKLNAIGVEFKGRNVLLVDDSIVRGTTSKEIVQMAREAGANKVYMASAAPPVKYPNVYGIDMPTPEELIASGRTQDEIRDFIGADALIYQDVDAMKRVVGKLNGKVASFEASCFDGRYITGDVSVEDFSTMREQRRSQQAEEDDPGALAPRAAERLRLTLLAHRSVDTAPSGAFLLFGRTRDHSHPHPHRPVPDGLPPPRHRAHRAVLVGVRAPPRRRVRAAHRGHRRRALDAGFGRPDPRRDEVAGPAVRRGPGLPDAAPRSLQGGGRPDARRRARPTSATARRKTSTR